MQWEPHKGVLLVVILELSSWSEVLATSTPTLPPSLPIPRHGCCHTLSEVSWARPNPPGYSPAWRLAGLGFVLVSTALLSVHPAARGDVSPTFLASGVVPLLTSALLPPRQHPIKNNANLTWIRRR